MGDADLTGGPSDRPLVYGSAHAQELTARELLTGGYDQRTVTYTLNAIGGALLWYNVAAKVEFGQTLYCPPGRLTITGQMYLEMLRQHLRKNPSDQTYPVAGALLAALREAFPC